MAVTFGPLDKVEFYCTFDIFQLTVVIGKPDRSCVKMSAAQYPSNGRCGKLAGI